MNTFRSPTPRKGTETSLRCSCLLSTPVLSAHLLPARGLKLLIYGWLQIFLNSFRSPTPRKGTETPIAMATGNDAGPSFRSPTPRKGTETLLNGLLYKFIS